MKEWINHKWTTSMNFRIFFALAFTTVIGLTVAGIMLLVVSFLESILGRAAITLLLFWTFYVIVPGTIVFALFYQQYSSWRNRSKKED